MGTYHLHLGSVGRSVGKPLDRRALGRSVGRARNSSSHIIAAVGSLELRIKTTALCYGASAPHALRIYVRVCGIYS